MLRIQNVCIKNVTVPLREVPPNLEIGLKTLVTRILFEDKTAVGVEAVRANRTFRIRARLKIHRFIAYRFIAKKIQVVQPAP